MTILEFEQRLGGLSVLVGLSGPAVVRFTVSGGSSVAGRWLRVPGSFSISAHRGLNPAALHRPAIGRALTTRTLPARRPGQRRTHPGSCLHHHPLVLVGGAQKAAAPPPQTWPQTPETPTHTHDNAPTRPRANTLESRSSADSHCRRSIGSAARPCAGALVPSLRTARRLREGRGRPAYRVGGGCGRAKTLLTARRLVYRPGEQRRAA